jgi:hypothetical protein
MPAHAAPPVTRSPEADNVWEMACTKSAPSPQDVKLRNLTYHVMFDPDSKLFVVNFHTRLVVYRVLKMKEDKQHDFGIIVVSGVTPDNTEFAVTFAMFPTGSYLLWRGVVRDECKPGPKSQ